MLVGFFMITMIMVITIIIMIIMIVLIGLWGLKTETVPIVMAALGLQQGVHVI